MPYLHLGVIAPPPEDLTELVDAGDDVQFYTGDPIVEYALSPASSVIEVHSVNDLPAVQHLPDLVVTAKPINWLLIAALVAGAWALSQGGGSSHKGWD